MNRIHIRSGIAALLLSASFALPALAQSITIAIGSEPSTLDPQLRDDGGERQVNDNIYETLMIRTATGALEPGLAAAAPVQTDPLTWEFTLRPGIMFTDGEPFDADSVVASVKRVVDPANASEQMAYMGPLADAEKVDDLTVRIKTSAPDPILPARMYWLKMVSAKYAADPKIAEVPVGTGPYKFESWDRGSGITLVANPQYWGGAPQVQEVTYRFIPEAGTRMSGLMSGEFDVVLNLLPEFAEAVPQYKAVSGLETSVIILGVDNPVVQDVRVRRALNMAIDRQTLADSLFAGLATPTKGQLILPGAFGYNETLADWPYDPEAAQKLVEEAGATGQTITLVSEAGRWLKDRELTEAVAAYWQAIGLNVNVQIDEFSVYLDKIFDMDHRPDSYFVLNSNELFDADREMAFAYEPGQGGASNSDKALGEAIVAARSETDMAKRKADYDAITQKLHDEAYDVPLLNHEDIYGLSSRMDWQPRIDAKILVKDMKVDD
ncbi:ABC transporter substrate-binding protein [Sinirhodobacter populi]|uniref:ABC transporter substrate-binding protein n=1 Tax=Paenirhodobacter populi TaxID=2306993 RepID=A0A443K936_9RHOB|nr:ABC transporter substrate-binding protein [Sinirhodobacter populi]RWR29278.1 ABC transporter substrate-binding protein [Sinirhodobacter populi]